MPLQVALQYRGPLKLFLQYFVCRYHGSLYDLKLWSYLLYDIRGEKKDYFSMANCSEYHIMLYYTEQIQGHQKHAALPLGRGLFLCSSASGNVNICVFKTTYHWEGSRGGDAG